jgi:hypothetical protein
MIFRKSKPIEEQDVDSQEFFGLSYANYLVLPRIALQSMPRHWQAQFFKMVRELEDTLEYPQGYTGEFMVTMKKGNKLLKSVLPHYRHHELPRKK